jgi:HAD superfamily hydrolase (TIGR01662 family)
MGAVVIKAVVFDLYRTLMTSHEAFESLEEALSKILREAGYEVYFQEIWAARQFVSFIDYTRGRANSVHEYYARVLERLEIRPDKLLIDKFVNKDLEMQKVELYPDVAPTVDKLRNIGVETAIVTTIATWRFVPLLEENKIEIDYICTAKEAGAVKPNPRIYRAVLKRFGISAQEAMMVGDDVKTDILPAKLVGMKAILLSRGTRIECRDADHIISSLNEITDLL